MKNNTDWVRYLKIADWAMKRHRIIKLDRKTITLNIGGNVLKYLKIEHLAWQRYYPK